MSLGAGLAAGAVLAGGAQILNQQQAQEQAKEDRRRVDAIINNIDNPEFDYSQITPEDYVLLQKYEPEIAAYVEEKAPELVRAQSEGAIRGREAQMAALDRYRQLSETGDDSQSRILREAALKEAAIQNQAQQGAIEDSFARRGQMGSTNQLAMQLLAQQQGNQAAQGAAQQSALDTYNRRLEALRSGAQLGSDIRGQDIDLESRNAQTLNDYNQRFAANKNQYNQYAAGLANEAARYNIGAAQDIANKNVAQRNTAAFGNLDAYNNLKQQEYDNQLAKSGMQVGSANARAAQNQQAAQDRASQISGIYGMGSGLANYQQGERRLDIEEERAKKGY